MHPPERTRCTRSNSVPALSGGSEEWEAAMPHRRALLREFCIEQHIRCNDGQMVRSIPDTCS